VNVKTFEYYKKKTCECEKRRVQESYEYEKRRVKVEDGHVLGDEVEICIRETYECLRDI